LLGRLRAKFEAKFRYDESGVPRLWKLDDPIDMYFKNASDVAEKLLGLFSKMDFPLSTLNNDIIENDVRNSLVIKRFLVHFIL
jgi:hypothetical protein